MGLFKKKNTKDELVQDSESASEENQEEVKPYFVEQTSAFDSARARAGPTASMMIVAVALGFIAGFIVWAAFVGSMVLTDLLWVEGVGEWQKALVNTPLAGAWLPLVVTTIGGLIIGLWTKYTQAMPIPMEAVMGQVKKNGKFGFKRPFATIVGFLLPLVFGGTVGPEAGLTGLMAHSCTTIGGALRRRGIKMAGIADISISAAFTGMFCNPLVGVTTAASDGMPADDLKNDQGGFDPYTYNMKFGAKIILYTAAALASVAGAYVFTAISGASFGFPRFEGVVPGSGELYVIPLCLLLGYLGGFLYQGSGYLFGKLIDKMPDKVVLKPILAGVILGVIAIWCPMVMFPGEEQLFELQEEWQTWTVALLIATGLLKSAAGPMCIKMGWAGGGMFPVIYAGAALGYGVALATGVDAMFCVALSTATLIAGTQRKIPMSLAFMLLAFPPQTIVFSLLAIFIGVVAPMPRAFFPDEEPKQKKKFFKNMKSEEELAEI